MVGNIKMGIKEIGCRREFN